jgi:ribose transport system ATP-binding protein
MLERSIAENLLITRYSAVSCCGLIGEKSQRSTALKWIGAMEVKAAGPEQRIDELSGGNQQKVALGRLMFHDARILLLDEPTRGIDVASKAAIYQRIGQAAQSGKSVVFVSSYLPELLGICDTIGVMCRGQLSAIRPASEWTEHEIIATAIGRTADSLRP